MSTTAITRTVTKRRTQKAVPIDPSGPGDIMSLALVPTSSAGTNLATHVSGDSLGGQRQQPRQFSRLVFRESIRRYACSERRLCRDNQSHKRLTIGIPQLHHFKYL